MVELLKLKEKYSISNEDFALLIEKFNNTNARRQSFDGAIMHEASKRDINYCDLTHESLPYDFDKVQMFAWWFITQFKTI